MQCDYLYLSMMRLAFARTSSSLSAAEARLSLPPCDLKSRYAPPPSTASRIAKEMSCSQRGKSGLRLLLTVVSISVRNGQLVHVKLCTATLL